MLHEEHFPRGLIRQTTVFRSTKNSTSPCSRAETDQLGSLKQPEYQREAAILAAALGEEKDPQYQAMVLEVPGELKCPCQDGKEGALHLQAQLPGVGDRPCVHEMLRTSPYSRLTLTDMRHSLPSPSKTMARAASSEFCTSRCLLFLFSSPSPLPSSLPVSLLFLSLSDRDDIFLILISSLRILYNIF